MQEGPDDGRPWKLGTATAPTYPSSVPDQGPIYTETILHQTAAGRGWIVEPFNAGSAALFILVAVYWLTRALPERRAFLSYAAFILLVGGIGGTLYHGLRSHVLFLALDVFPIMILTVSAVYWFVGRLTGAAWMAATYTMGGLVLFGVVIRGIRAAFPGLTSGPVIGYGLLGLFVTVPMLAFVVRTQRRQAGWVALAIGAFVVGMYFRAVDRDGLLPMGTHFLWHTFGALMTHLLLLYLWRMRDVDESTGRSASVGASP